MGGAVEQDIEVCIVGGLAVSVGGEPLEMRGEVQRAVCAYLALAAGRSVSSDELVAAIWAYPPSTAAVAVRGAVSKLRAVGLAPWLSGGRGGYRFDLPERVVELLAAVRAGGPAGCAPEDLLPELLDQPFAIGLRADLVERRCRSEMADVESLLHQGDTAAAAAAALALLQALPGTEGAARVAATALAADGRPGEAVEVLDALERSLVSRRIGVPDWIREMRGRIVRLDPEFVTPQANARVERSTIPVPATSFLGRRDELAALADARAEARLLTVLGPGGCGKTRLAIEAALSTSGGVDTEQYLVDLTPIGDETGLLEQLARTVGSSRAAVDAIVHRLDGRPLLLILDNAEHVIGAVRTLVPRLLGGCRGLAVMVTSREALNVPGEWILPLTGLSGADARALFKQRVRERGPLLGGEVADAPVDAVCRALDGLPLAIELAVAELDLLPLDAIADAVRSEEGGEGAHRHASLTRAIEWSVSRLDEPSRRLFAELSRFAGTFDMAAVDGICGAEASPARLAAGLVRKSLLSVEGSAVTGRSLRMLESMKAVMRRADAGADRESWDASHLAWFVDLVEGLEPDLRAPGRAVAQRRLDLSAPDLDQALDFAVSRGNRDAALRLCAGRAEHWMRRGRFQEGRERLERALAVQGIADPELESRALTGLALLCYQSGDLATAFDCASRAFEAASQAADLDRQALLLGYEAYGKGISGDARVAGEMAALALANIGSVAPWVACTVHLGIGQAHRALGRPADALEHLESSRRIADEIGYAWISASARYVAAKVLVELRRPREAIAILVPTAHRCLHEEDPTGALIMCHLAAGAAATIGMERLGAALLALVDTVGARYEYHPLRAEGEDARVHHERVRQSLTETEYATIAARHRDGGFPELLELMGELGTASAERGSRGPGSAATSQHRTRTGEASHQSAPLTARGT